MNTWTRQMGYPVITVIRDGDNYILQQDRFLLDGNSSLGVVGHVVVVLTFNIPNRIENSAKIS
jgi:aminopeptidase N